LLEGLEIAEVSSRKAFGQTVTHRIDPEYFQKNHLADEELLLARKNDFVAMASIGLSVDASAFYPSIEGHYGEGEFPFLRVADVNTFIDYEGCETIPEELCGLYPTLARVNPGDIVFTKGGSIARVGLVTQPAAVSRDLIFLNTSKQAAADQIFLFLYFQTQFFNRSLIRSSSQTAQPHLTITLVRELKTLVVSDRFKGQLLSTVQSAFSLRDKSMSLLKKAETTLLAAMALDTWQPIEVLSYERSSSEAFAAGRLDSQYFAPRVNELMQRLGRDGLRLGDVAPARHERFVPDKVGVFDYIEIGGLGANGTATAETLAQAEAPSRATQFVRAGDVITSTVRPIRRLSALIAQEQDGNVCSSGFVVLEPREISSEVLLTYLRLPLVCELMDLHTSATMYPNISEKDLLALPIPAIDSSMQRDIQQLVRDAASSRDAATNLLSAAKRAVEIAIEDSEASALAYLQGGD
jgi:type I restriction enzyme S subunit